MKRSIRKRARRQGEADGRAHAKNVHQDSGIEGLMRANTPPDWDVPARCALAAEARMIPKAAHELYYDAINRGAQRYIDETGG